MRLRGTAYLCCKVEDSVYLLGAEKVCQQVTALEIPFRELQAAKRLSSVLGALALPQEVG